MEATTLFITMQMLKYHEDKIMESILKFDSVRYETSIEEGEPDNLIAVIDGVKYHVPYDTNNIHYAEIMRQVKEGTLTIKDAD